MLIVHTFRLRVRQGVDLRALRRALRSTDGDLSTVTARRPHPSKQVAWHESIVHSEKDFAGQSGVVVNSSREDVFMAQDLPRWRIAIDSRQHSTSTKHIICFTRRNPDDLQCSRVRYDFSTLAPSCVATGRQRICPRCSKAAQAWS